MQLKQYKESIELNGESHKQFIIKPCSKGQVLYHKGTDTYYQSKRSKEAKIFKSPNAVYNKLRELGASEVLVKL